MHDAERKPNKPGPGTREHGLGHAKGWLDDGFI